MSTILTVLAACAAMIVLGSLVEYVVHRLMHAGKVLGRKHAEHHAEGVGQGWLGELQDYLLPAVVPAVLLYLVVAWPIALGASLGALLYAAFAAYSHQVQHERPELVFWLARPVHALHHRHKMWHHNFGLTFDVWDRVFGTYRAEEWEPASRPSDHSLSEYFDIKWR